MQQKRRYYPAIILTVVLLFIMVNWGSALEQPSVLLFGLYIACIWLVTFIQAERWLIVIYFVLFILTLVCWIMFEAQVPIVLLGFLVGMISFRLSWRNAMFGLVVVTLVTFVMRYFVDHQSLLTALNGSFVFIAIFTALLLRRSRRLRDEEQMRHTAQLEQMNLELQMTHAKLQAAHVELEQAVVQSMRYVLLEERNRIARDIHDSIGHQLTSVIVQLQALPYVMKSSTEESEHIVRNVLDVAKHCLQEARAVVHEMGNDIAGTGLASLRGLVQQVMKNSSLHIEMQVVQGHEEEVWPTTVSVVLYRSLQEALTNMIRHAEASHARVRIEQTAQQVMMTIADDGIFTAASTWREGFGLASMRARCEKAGGSCTITDIHPHGMQIQIIVPLQGERSEDDEEANTVS